MTTDMANKNEGAARPRPTDPLRLEHRDLLPHIDRLAIAADRIAEGEPEAASLVDEALEFLENHLIVHAKAEEVALYPVVAEAMGAPGATATMSRDHSEVVALTHRLRLVRSRLDAPDRATAAHPATAPDPATARDVVRLLDALNAIIALHFAKEEEVYLEVLDRSLTEAAAQRMFVEMEAAADAARAEVKSQG